ncbi:MAG: hypothetical protein AVDCRST_MAG91-621, partial [uncultured Sphingomonadaceae bacterium]
MEVTRRGVLTGGAVGAVGSLVAAGSASAAPVGTGPGRTALTADQALALLREGNRRFI